MLIGGQGADRFVFTGTFDADRVNDFTDDVDTLVFDDALWGGGLTASQVVSGYASVVGGDVVFDFGSGNTVTLAGFASLGPLSDDIVFV